MKQLPRGYELMPGCTIKRSIALGNEWTIYQTSKKVFALAASPSIVSTWNQFGCGNIFKLLPDENIHIFIASSPEYIISSLMDGPFPESVGQIEAFSSAFGNFRKRNPDIHFSNAVYIEEYSLILPDNGDDTEQDDALMFGRWLTGGVSISADNVPRMSSFMTWVSQDALFRCVETAGFEVQEKSNTGVVQTGNTIEKKNSISNEEFHLDGRPDLEQFINDNIVDILRHEDEYARMGISFPGATILYGPPGCGKTYAVDRLTDYLGWPRYNIEAGTVASPYIHDTSKKIAEVFSLAISNAPSILVIDEMEAFLTNRAAASNTSSHRVEEVAEFLRRIPEAIEKHVLIFAMTNMINSIDPAILRRGRFDHIVEVKMASAKEIESLLYKKFESLPISNDVNAKEIARQLEGHPLSDVSYVLKEAGRFAVKSRKEKIDRVCMEAALGTLPKANNSNSKKIGF